MARLSDCDLPREILYENFDINIDQLHDIVKALLPLCDCAPSPLTDIWYRGFGKDGMWIVKEEVNVT